VNASFGCDHRVLDGATFARFVKKWTDYIENPETLFLTLNEPT